MKIREYPSDTREDRTASSVWKVRRDVHLQVMCAEDQGRHVLRLARKLDLSLIRGQYDQAVMLSSNIASLSTILSTRLSGARSVALALAAITGESERDILGEEV